MEPRTALLALLLSAALLSPMPAFPASPLPAPMLATRFHDAGDLTHWLVSEKLDGVRARWDGHRLLTRNGDPIDAPRWFTAGWPPQAIEGELWIARGQFQQVSDLVRALRPDQAGWRNVRFMAFDLPGNAGPFAMRAQRLQSLVALAGLPALQLIAQTRLHDRAALDARLRAVLAAGCEGLMLHRAAGRYVGGRSDGLLKYKAAADDEAWVIGYRPGRGKYAGQVGALLVEDARGRRFALGSGLSDADRRHPPRHGSVVTYRYDGLTAKGTPRFARYLRVRAEPERGRR